MPVCRNRPLTVESDEFHNLFRSYKVWRPSVIITGESTYVGG